MSASRRLRGSIGLLLAACCAQVAAEFYTWTDAAGRRHVSNVPPAGVRADGGLREGYHPYSVQAQHARLRAELERQGAAIAAAGAADPDAGRSGLVPFTLDRFDDLIRP
jgi:hypothetical protein